VRGAFTGALTSRKGKFEQADGGTLFLDEIADMSLKTRPRCCASCRSRPSEPVGERARTRDVRVIAATNKRLDHEISRGAFREDLYYRLNVIPFRVPPLRERRDDIPALTRHFLAGLAGEYGRRIKDISPEALGVLTAQAWAGNVRELRNVIERLVIMTPGERIEARHLPASLMGTPAADGPATASDRPGERQTLPLARPATSSSGATSCGASQECGGNMSRTAEAWAWSAPTSTARCAATASCPAARRDARAGARLTRPLPLPESPRVAGRPPFDYN